MNKQIIEFVFYVGHSKEYNIEAIWNNAVWIKKSELDNLLSSIIWYLGKTILKKKILRSLY